MSFFSICLLVPVINAFIVTQIHQNAIYRFHSPCAFIGNTSWIDDASVQSCIWECVHTYDCQTATYFDDDKICSMFLALCEDGIIESSGTLPASVICYRKNHRPLSTCSSTATTKHQDEETTAQLQKVTSTKRDTTTTKTTTTTSVSDSTSLWSFDNNAFDSLSTFHGTPINGATYKSPGINGYGLALLLDGNSDQYVEVSNHRNLANRSFTVEMWFYCTDMPSSDMGLFGQRQYWNTSHLLHYIIRANQAYLGFYSNDLTGSTTIQKNTWYHVAFVYDYSFSEQIIYLNGVFENNRSSPSAYQGTVGSIFIGKTEQYSQPTYFSGYIDEVLLTMRAKTAIKILDDATLVCWHSFDDVSNYDSGPLHFNGTAVDISFVPGRKNQAVNFTSNSSYYQIGGFVLLGLSNYSYSVSLWIHPSITNGSTLVHMSTKTNGLGWCIDLIRFSPIGEIVVTISNKSLGEVVGPLLPVNVWTHIVYSYSVKNGLRLYINGTLNSTAGPSTYSVSEEVNILTLGNGLQGSIGNSCIGQSIAPNVYNGLIDEFRVYSRELNLTDIHILANL